ncbi:MAG: hypothetical protein K6E10_05215 [Eubacterium sp.]|nr:hypothetical protein [Eubacterium sp.]
MKKNVLKLASVGLAMLLLSSCGKVDEVQEVTSEEETKVVEEASEETEDTEESSQEVTEEASQADAEKTEEKTEATTEEKTEAADSDEAEAEKYYKAVYGPVLDETYGMLSNYDPEADYNYYSNGIMEECMYGEPEELLQTISYVYRDINGDDMPELLIGKDQSDLYTDGDVSVVYAGYTIKGNEPVMFLEGWARSMYCVTEFGHFYYFGSGGASISATADYYLEKGETVLTCQDFYFTDDSDGETKVYHNTTSNWNPDDSEIADITLDEYYNLPNRYNFELLDWTCMGDYKSANGSDASSSSDSNSNGSEDSSQDAMGGSAVKVEFTDEVSGDSSNYLTFEPADTAEYTTHVLFSVEKEVKNFKLLALTAEEIDEDGNIKFSYEELFSLDALTPDQPLNAGMNFIGTIPNNGFMYTDDAGQNHIFVVSESGMDGSIVVWEYK